MLCQPVTSSNLARSADIPRHVFHRPFRMYNRIPQDRTPLLTILYPFEFETWVAFASSIIVLVLSLVAPPRISILIPKEKRLSWYQSMVIAVAPMLSDGLPRHWRNLFKSHYNIGILSVWLPCGLLLSFAYSSNLLANLVSVEKEEAVDTFEQIVDEGHMVTALDTELIHLMLKRSPREIVRRAYKVTYFPPLFLVHHSFKKVLSNDPIYYVAFTHR